MAAVHFRLYDDGRKRRVDFTLPPDERPGDVSTFVVNGSKWAVAL